MLAFKREPLLRPRALKDLRELGEPLPPALVLGAEHPVLLGRPSQPEPEVQPAARDVVHDRRVFGDPEGVVERGEEHRRPELDATGARGNGG